MNEVSIVIPVYNESSGILSLYQSLLSSLRYDEFKYEIIFVDDGSCDDSVIYIRNLPAKENVAVSLISLSRNFGHQVAVRVGYKYSTGDVVVCMDADLQHPPEIINMMLNRYKEGFDIVCGIRDDSLSNKHFKKHSSKLFYAIWSWLTGVKLEPGSSDFRLLSRPVIDQINCYEESFLFIRGLIPLLGYDVYNIYYYPQDRSHGESKYTLRKMLRLSKDGILWGSIKPLRLASILAFITALTSVFFGVYTLFIYFFSESVVPGWTSIVAIICLVGSLQLFSIGIVGEYLAQVLQETRKRPLYHIKKITKVIRE